MIHRSILASAIGIAASLTATGVAHASCNSLPVASETIGQGPIAAAFASSGGTPHGLPGGFAGAFRYKAALGRVDGIMFTPSGNNQMRFAADDFCVSDRLKATAEGAPVITPIGPIDDLAIFVAYDAAPGYSVPVWPFLQTTNPRISIPALRDALRELPLAHDEGERRRPVYFALGDNWDPRVERVSIGPGVDGVGVKTPSLVDEVAAASARPASWHLESSGVRILAVHVREKTPVQLAADLDAFMRNKCSRICPDFRLKNVVLCVDAIYSNTIPPRGIDHPIVYREDPLLCSVSIPNDLSAYNHFNAVCDDEEISLPASTPTPSNPHAASASRTTLTGCATTSPTLKVYRGDCGALQIPLDYTEVRKRRDSTDGTFVDWVNRRLSGLSGLGREVDDDEKRIFVPGREFLGSTPRYDGGGERPDTNWRRPNVDVWFPDGQESAEFGLTGVVDQNSSIVHILPRYPAEYVCPARSMIIQPGNVPVSLPARGCTKVVPPGVVDAAIDCACDDTEPAGCTCDKIWGGQYFACDGGDRTNMPCTRDEHCKSRDLARAGGHCGRKPICRPVGTVWRRKPKNDDPDPAGSVPCWADSDCSAGEQCGYSLFDFADRIPDTMAGVYELDRDVVLLSAACAGPNPPAACRTRRGACADDHELACSNASTTGAPEMCPAPDRCRGFSLIAGKAAP